MIPYGDTDCDLRYPYLMSGARKPVPTWMTVADFLSWNPGDPTGVRWQLVDGSPVAMAPASETHAALQNEIGRQIGNHLLDRRSRNCFNDAGAVFLPNPT